METNLPFIAGMGDGNRFHVDMQKLFETNIAFFKDFSKFSHHSYCLYGGFCGIFNMDSVGEKVFFPTNCLIFHILNSEL